MWRTVSNATKVTPTHASTVCLDSNYNPVAHHALQFLSVATQDAIINLAHITGLQPDLNAYPV